MNWKWPAKPGGRYEPWYIIGWRVFWVPAFEVLRLLLILVVALAHGLKAACRVAEDINYSVDRWHD